MSKLGEKGSRRPFGKIRNIGMVRPLGQACAKTIALTLLQAFTFALTRFNDAHSIPIMSMGPDETKALLTVYYSTCSSAKCLHTGAPLLLPAGPTECSALDL